MRIKNNVVFRTALAILFAAIGVLPASGKKTSTIFPETYDLIINGAGLDGYFIALEASKEGLKTLVLDKRTSPGYDIVAKRKLWVAEKGIENWDKTMLDLFFPVEEQEENWNTDLQSPRRSKSGDELLVFAGSLKKRMLQTLLNHHVDVLLMTDVCGIMTDEADKVTGVVVASKHGVFSIKGHRFIDATDNNLFTRNLFNQKYSIKEASFVLEFEHVSDNVNQEIKLPNVGVTGDRISVHAGKKDKGMYLLEYRFPVKCNDFSKIEQQARLIASQIGKNIGETNNSFSEAAIHYTALECSFAVTGKITEKLPLVNYLYIDNKVREYSCETISQRLDNACRLIGNITASNEAKHTTTVHYAGGKVAYTEPDERVWEKGFPTMLSVFPIERLTVKTEKTPLLVVGAGTAGTMVALAAGEKKTPVTVVEYFNDLGGTKTMAGVNDFYFGLQQHELIRQQEREKEAFGAEHGFSIGSSTMPRRFYYLDLLQKNKVNIINGVIMCGVEKEKNRLKTVIVCENGKIRKFESVLTVDATGDADVAHFAGEEWHVGDSRMEITQNYSHWDVAYYAKQKDFNRDYDIINSTEVLESQRGLYLAHAEAHYYDFYPMQAIRESRRPTAVYNINASDILRDVRYEDIIAQARSDYDPHYFGTSELTRCGFMLPHHDSKTRVNIPYRAIVPKHIDGLLLSGKGIGQTYKALQFTRMSADVTVLGYVTGLIASAILEQGVDARNFSIKSIQDELIAMNYLPSGLEESKPTTFNEIITDLELGVDSLLIKAILESSNEMLPLLEKSFKQNKSVLIAKALAWFGKSEGVDLILDELKADYGKELLEGHANTYFEKYNPQLVYWKVNQNIGLLAMAGSSQSHAAIQTILSETVSGGEKVAAEDAYNKGRIDLQLIPYYNRIVSLCFYIERNPDRIFTAGLERLLDDEYIREYKTAEYNKTRWRLYSANLELLLAAASARCGSYKGLSLLADYLTDIHSNFRTFAWNELRAVTQQDFGYNTTAWKQFLSKGEQFPVAPLKKDIEL